jgi:hypothetical protein
MTVEDDAGLGRWPFEQDGECARLTVEIPETTLRARIRTAYRRNNREQPPGDLAVRVPDFLTVSCDGELAILRTVIVQGRQGPVRLPIGTFDKVSGQVLLAPATRRRFRLYRVVHPPASYALMALVAGCGAGAINVSLAIGSALDPPPIGVSDFNLAVLHVIAAVLTVGALAVAFWATHVWEDSSSAGKH